MKNQIMLLSMPNNGSDWMASNIAKQKSYFREFFNPVTNDNYKEELSKEFGCELTPQYQKIASLNIKACEDVYKNTWEKENYNFTKENYSVFKIPFFVEKFNCIALMRDIKNSFPPKREKEVYEWYNSIYNSMLFNIETLPNKVKNIIKYSEKNTSCEIEKTLICYQIYQMIFIDYCNEYKIPILIWENLVEINKIKKELNKISQLDLDIENLHNSISESINFEKKDFKIYAFNPKIYFLKML